jgi:hypothetical protein
MGNESGPRLSGDDYQHLYSWYELLRLWDAGSEYDHGQLEHPRAGAADDVTLHPKTGSAAPTRFTQVKWHGTRRQPYSFASMIRSTRRGKSLLRKLFESWEGLRGSGLLDIRLVSNGSAAAHPDLGAYIADGGELTEAFFTSKAPTVVQARERWIKETGGSPSDAIAFFRDLRLQLGYGGTEWLREQFDNAMRARGLLAGERARRNVMGELRERIQRGGTWKQITREELLKIADSCALWADAAEAPKVSLWIHGWARQRYDAPPTYELDWTSYFDRDQRRIPPPDVWTNTLLPELREVRSAIEDDPEGRFIDLHGKMPLSLALAVGFTFPTVRGFRFRTEQPTRGDIELWVSSVPESDAAFRLVAEGGTPGKAVVLGLCVTGPAQSDVVRLSWDIDADAWVYAEPSRGARQDVVKDASDAVALVRSAKELIRDVRERYRTREIHLALYGPVALALFLGQALNGVGTITAYERDRDGNYQEAVTLHTA